VAAETPKPVAKVLPVAVAPSKQAPVAVAAEPPKPAAKVMPAAVAPSKQAPAATAPAPQSTPAAPSKTTGWTSPAGLPGPTPPAPQVVIQAWPGWKTGRYAVAAPTEQLFPSAYYASPNVVARGTSRPSAANDPALTRSSTAPAASQAAPLAPATSPRPGVSVPRPSALSRLRSFLTGEEELETHPAGCDCNRHPASALPSAPSAGSPSATEPTRRVKIVVPSMLLRRSIGSEAGDLP
jgi:hypothetical protein